MRLLDQCPPWAAAAASEWLLDVKSSTRDRSDATEACSRCVRCVLTLP